MAPPPSGEGQPYGKFNGDHWEGIVQSNGIAEDSNTTTIPAVHDALIANSADTFPRNGKVDVEGGLVDIAARQPGIVTQVMVQEGDEVHRGGVGARSRVQTGEAP